MSEEVKPELLPCPFCACEAWVHSNPKAFAGHPGLRLGHRVECEGTCHAMTCWWHDKENAIKAWNVRAHDPALSAALARNKKLEICIHLGRKLYFIGLAEGEAAQTGGYEAAKEEERLEQKANEIANALEDIVPHIVGFDVDVALAALKEDPGPVGTNSEQGPSAPEGT